MLKKKLVEKGITVEQLKVQCEINLEFYNKQKSLLWDIRDKRLNGTKKHWNTMNHEYSTRIKLLEEILEFISGKNSINNLFIKNSKNNN